MAGRQTRIVLLALFLAGAGLATAVPVRLTAATATYDQGAPYTVGSAIDGSVTSAGWGVYGGQTTAQTAVFQTAAPLTAPELTLAIVQNQGNRHTINELRVSATTDPNPTATSGAAWTPLAPESFAAGASQLRDVGGNRLRRSGIAGTDTYTVTASPPMTGLTGFRVETFPVGGRVGGHPNGNFVLTELLVDAGSNLALGRPVTASAATWPGRSPLLLTDGDRDTFVHGASGSATTFAYTIDLGKPVAADAIRVANRSDGCCPDRLTNYRISLHNDAGGAIGDAVWSADVRTDGSHSGVGGIDTVAAAADPTGQFVGQWVRVEKIDDGTQNYWLQAGEVEVDGSYLNNVAQGAPARASAATWGSFTPANIVDGDLNTISHPASGSGDEFAFDVNLGGPVNLNSIYVHNRNDGCCPDRLSDYTVSLHADDRGQPGPVLWSGAVRADGTNSGVGGVDTVTAGTGTGDFAGQWLRITGPAGVAYAPQIAEVEAYSTQDSPWIGLGNATADKSQSGYPAGNILTDNTAGWAAYDGISQATPQTAAVETTEDAGFADGTTLTFTLEHQSPWGDHNLGRFRLAATTADRDQFADGLPNGGDLGAPSIWTELAPLSVVSTGGAAVTIGPDNTVLLRGANPGNDTYLVTANTTLQGITGFRLEALADASLPHSGPGRSTVNGNYVLTYLAAAESPLGARRVNIAQAAPVSVVGASSYNSPQLINDGVITDAVGASSFVIPDRAPQGVGYDLGGFATIDSLRVYQHAAAGGGGTRRRLESLTVYTSGGARTFSGLPDQDVLDLDLGGVETAYVFIRPGSQHAGAPDPQLGIREVEVFSRGLGVTPRENVALGRPATVAGSGWCCGSPADLTDGVLTWGPGLDHTGTAIYNNALSPTNGWIDIDLGRPGVIDTLGIVQQTLGGPAGRTTRRMLEDIELLFSNDAFATILDTQAVTLMDGVAYQQVGFDPVGARYVRINPLSQYAAGTDPRIGIVEVQLFRVPEPGTLTLLGLGAVALLRRRRQR